MKKNDIQKEPYLLPSTGDLLRKVSFFSGLNDAILSKFERIAMVQSFQSEETIMLGGDARRTVFFIAKGQARVFYDAKKSRNNLLNLLDAGDFFGEIQLFSENAKSSISLKAESQCTVIIFKGKDFINEIKNYPELLLAFLRETTKKLNKAYAQIAALSMSTIKKRIKSCIMLFMEERGIKILRKGKAITVLKNRPTQQQMAEMSGTTRETVNRELANLEKNGYIEMDGGDLVLLKELPMSDDD
ncbi:MAG: Crp/Fnr family transcriptional regulator [Fibromonadales bacterium]|nr:Crp/Fnr family transcriptional regulator [Fibromonadales bacterium]